MRIHKKSAALLALILIWLVAIAGGLKVLSDYTNAAGAIGQTQSSWPSSSSITLSQDHKPTLVLFLHPKCPCSDATVGELDSLMAKIDGKAQVYAVFVQPKGWSDEEIRRQPLWIHARSIPGVTTLLDSEGKEAVLFGALTSGHLFGYDGQGRLAFTGGITIGRGHMGDNAGLQAVTEFVNSGRASQDPAKRQTKVFGCSLFKAHEHGSHGKVAS